MATYSTTLSATLIFPLTDVERISGWNKKFVIPYSTVALASATTVTDVVTVVLGSSPANWAVGRARACITTAFTTTGTGTLTVQVGSTSSVAAFISAQSVLTVATLGQTSTMDQLTNCTATAAVNLVATFTSAGEAGLSVLTAGSITVLLAVDDIGDKASIYQPNQ